MSNKEINKQIDKLTKTIGITFVKEFPAVASLKLQQSHNRKVLGLQAALVIGTWALVLVTFYLIPNLENQKREIIKRCSISAATSSSNVMRATGLTEEEAKKLYEEVYTICLRSEGIEK